MFKLAVVAVLSLGLSCAHGQQAFVGIGKGNIKTELGPGGEREPPVARWDSEVVQPGPAPSNQWYSSLIFSDDPQPLYAQPASYRPTATAFEVDLPAMQAQENATQGHSDITFPHRASLQVRPAGLQAAVTRVSKVSDWALEMVMREAGKEALRVTVARGSPYSYYRSATQTVRLQADPDASPQWQAATPGSPHRMLKVRDQTFAVFVPPGTLWQTEADGGVQLVLPQHQTFFTIATLPDDRPETFVLFAKYAFNVIDDTKAMPSFDERTSTLSTQFQVSTRALLPGDAGTLIALYPHHWHQNPTLGPSALLPLSYPTVRGPLRLMRGDRFATRYTYHGVLPHWPGLQDTGEREQLKALVRKETEFGAEEILNRRKAGTYWEGKGFNRAAQVMAIAEQQGDLRLRDELLKGIKRRFEAWFAPGEAAPRYFFQSRGVGTLIGYPDEYGSAAELNDHHFHYGYWIFAAAQVALRDPHWARKDQWGAMVEAMIADIATPTRDGHATYPKLRHFDAFEGHSWASGVSAFFDGNNHESSSEALHAWAAMILWGEITGNRAVRDTGIYLYVTEAQAAQHYWFDLHKLVFKSAYSKPAVGIVWGSKYVYTTWFSENPRHIHGINLLPITTASVHLAAHKDHIQANLGQMDQAFQRFLKDGGQSVPDVWQDIFASYLALADPQAALKVWNPAGSVEDGDSRTRTFHWLHSLARMGRPDLAVTANTTLYGVFKADSGRRTYLAYNASAQPRDIRFSDGTQLKVAARSLGQIVR